MSNKKKLVLFKPDGGQRHMHYRTHGTCSTAIELEIVDGVITACAFTNGCRGNLIGLSRMVVGRDAREVMQTLRGIPCRGNASCPDQLSKAIEQYLSTNTEIK